MTHEPLDMETPLPGTVKFYDQHVVICTGHHQWAPKIEAGDPFIAALTKAIKAEAPGFAKITACDAPSSDGGYDVMLFPANKKFIGLTEADIPAFLRVLHGETDGALKWVSLEKPVWLVCGHASRDGRCGERGPVVQAALDSALTAAGLRDAVDLYTSSHVGQHRFAGNLICYPVGNWYGRVTPADAPEIVSAELVAKKPLARLWRGRMGTPPSAQISLIETF